MDNQLHIKPERFRTEDIEHLRSCEYCRMQFADHIEERELMTAPKNMQAAILQKSRQLDVQVIAGSNQISKKLQLFYYSLKVSFAAAFAMGLLIWNPYLANPPKPPLSLEFQIPPAVRIRDKTQDLTDIIQNFSNQLFKTEDSSHDKQKK